MLLELEIVLYVEMKLCSIDGDGSGDLKNLHAEKDA
jgi:hypothetical protein